MIADLGGSDSTNVDGVYQSVFPRCLSSSGTIAVLPASSSHGAYLAHCRVLPFTQKKMGAPHSAAFTFEGGDVSIQERHLDNHKVSPLLSHAKREKRDLSGRVYFCLSIHHILNPVVCHSGKPLSISLVKKLPLFFESCPPKETRPRAKIRQADHLGMSAIDALQWAGPDLLVVMSFFRGEVLIVQTFLADCARDAENGQEGEMFPTRSIDNDDYRSFDAIDAPVVLRDVRVKAMSAIAVRWTPLDFYVSGVVALAYHSSVRLISVDPCPATRGESRKVKLANEYLIHKKFVSVSINAMPYSGGESPKRDSVLICGCTHTCCVSVYVWPNPTQEPSLLREVMMGKGVSFFGIATLNQPEEISANLPVLSSDYVVHFAVVGSMRCQVVRSEESKSIVLGEPTDTSAPITLSTGTLRGPSGIFAEIEEKVTKRLLHEVAREPLNMVYSPFQQTRMSDGENAKTTSLENLVPSLSVTAPRLTSDASESFLLLVSVQQRQLPQTDTQSESSDAATATVVSTKQYTLAAPSLKEFLSKLGSTIRLLPFIHRVSHSRQDNSYLCVTFYSNEGVLLLHLLHQTEKPNSSSHLASVEVAGRYSVKESGRADFIIGADWYSPATTRSGSNWSPTLILLAIQGCYERTNPEQGKFNDAALDECASWLTPATVWLSDGLEITTLQLKHPLIAAENREGRTITIDADRLRALIHEVVHEESQEILTRLESRLDRLENYLITRPSDDVSTYNKSSLMEQKKLIEARVLVLQACTLLRRYSGFTEAPPASLEELQTCLIKLLPCLSILNSFDSASTSSSSEKRTHGDIEVKLRAGIYRIVGVALGRIVEFSNSTPLPRQTNSEDPQGMVSAALVRGPGLLQKERSVGDGDLPWAKEPENQHDPDAHLAVSLKPSPTPLRWGDVCGCKEAITALKQTLTLPRRFPMLFQGVRKPWQRVLLYGPPGTGKTLLAGAAAGESDAPLLSLSPADLLSRWVGESEKQARAAFAQAACYERCVLFLDEIDALCGARGGQAETEVARRLKTELLLQLQALPPSVVVLAATNLPWEIDSAILRRFDRLVYVGLPTRDARRRILHEQLDSITHSLSPADLESVLDMTESYSVSDMVHLLSLVIMRTVEGLVDTDAYRLATQEDLDEHFSAKVSRKRSLDETKRALVESKRQRPYLTSRSGACSPMSSCNCSLSTCETSPSSTRSAIEGVTSSKISLTNKIKKPKPHTKDFSMVVLSRSHYHRRAQATPSYCPVVLRKSSSEGEALSTAAERHHKALTIPDTPLSLGKNRNKKTAPPTTPPNTGARFMQSHLLETEETPTYYVPCNTAHPSALQHLKQSCIRPECVLLPPVRMVHVREAMRVFIPSVTADDLKRFDVWRKRHCAHT